MTALHLAVPARVQLERARSILQRAHELSAVCPVKTGLRVQYPVSTFSKQQQQHRQQRKCMYMHSRLSCKLCLSPNRGRKMQAHWPSSSKCAETAKSTWQHFSPVL
jgi:hypothetical protein